MKGDPSAGNSRDLLSNRLLAVVLFCLPAIAMIVTANYRIGGWRTVVWTTALSIIGTACLANAVRCGRVHCWLTGPFFLVMAIVTLLYGLGVLPLGRNGWTVISLTILVGAVVLSCAPEVLFGKYRKGRTRSTD